MTAAAVSLTAPGLVQRLSAATRVQNGRKTVAAEQAAPADEALFARALAGDREALGTLIRNYEQGLFSFLVRLTNGDWHQADDLFQETFLHAMRSGNTFNQDLGFKPWLMAIAMNLVRDEARKRKVRGEVPLENGLESREFASACLATGGNPGAQAEKHDEEQLVQRALARLTLLQREVVLLHFYEGSTLVEAAAVLGVAAGTVKSRLHAALMRLSELLGQQA